MHGKGRSKIDSICLYILTVNSKFVLLKKPGMARHIIPQVLTPTGRSIPYELNWKQDLLLNEPLNVVGKRHHGLTKE